MAPGGRFGSARRWRSSVAPVWRLAPGGDACSLGSLEPVLPGGVWAALGKTCCCDFCCCRDPWTWRTKFTYLGVWAWRTKSNRGLGCAWWRDAWWAWNWLSSRRLLMGEESLVWWLHASDARWARNSYVPVRCYLVRSP